MPAEVKILIKGFSNADSVAEMGTERTQPTVTLVRDVKAGVVMVVDPGILSSQQVLIEALAEEGLSVDDVNVVFITHSHLDHYRNAGMFPNAKILEYYGLWKENSIENWAEDFTPNIKVLHTPGHDYTGISLFVSTGQKSEYPGVVAICGDIFWYENYPQDPYDDTYASNPERLKESREVILRMADWVIPGHGDIYKNNKSEAPFNEEVPVPKDYFENKKQAKITILCKKCGKIMKQNDKCQCRPYLCFRCCECGYDCPACGCSHKK